MLVLVTYLALFFCLGVVVSGQILTNGFVEPPVRPPQERDATQGGLPDRGTSDRLQSREAERTWVRTCVWWHWAFSLIACTVSFITQVLLYVWLEEPNSIRIVVSDALVNTTVSLAVAVHTFLSSHVGQLAFRIT
ncbi:hypothetical protein EI94DRAFT_1723844 [Lactarius quietus]|nr:hypothetical protein EI94DRAFT_1723844 [Lactarius quietus]